MTGPGRPEVTLSTLHGDLTALHEDLTAGFGEMQTAFADLKTTLVAGFRSLPSRESADEMVRLLRESNTQLDIRIREQHLEVLQILHAVVEGQRQLVEGQRQLVEGQRSLSADIRALIARIDALIKGRRDGDSTA
jgi:hypothetical protein